MRIELQKIAEDKDVTTHRAKIDQLSSRVNCSIRVLPDYDHTSRKKFNCFEYALGLTEQLPNFRLADLADYGVLANWRFIDYLREQDILHEKPIDDLHDGDLVIYFKETKAEHSGKLKKGRVISKCGSGLMYDHEPYETPVNYGEPRYFKAIPFRETKDLFLNYARGRNVHEDLRYLTTSWSDDALKQCGVYLKSAVTVNRNRIPYSVTCTNSKVGFEFTFSSLFWSPPGVAEKRRRFRKTGEHCLSEASCAAPGIDEHRRGLEEPWQGNHGFGSFCRNKRTSSFGGETPQELSKIRKLDSGFCRSDSYGKQYSWYHPK